MSFIVHYKEYVDIDEELRPLDQESYNRLQLSASCRLTLGAGDSHEVNEVVYLSSASQGWFIILIVTKSSLVPYALQMKIFRLHLYFLPSSLQSMNMEVPFY